MKPLLRIAMLAPLVVALSACGSGGDDDTEERQVRQERPGLITINSTPPTTSAASVGLSGTRSSGVDSVTWSNAAGGSGTATLANDACEIPFQFLPCYRWSASIPLFAGDNVITVIGNSGFDEFTRLTVTIRRFP